MSAAKGGVCIKGLASVFTEKEQTALLEHCGIALSDTKDYTGDEILEIYDLVCDTFPYEYDADGYPLELGWIFEHIVDKLVDL